MDSCHVATWIGLHPLRREPERRVGLFRTGYVPYYKCLCPNQEGTAEFLLDLYGKVADIPEVDYIHLDHIRYVDVILARGLGKNTAW